jgi:REP element-mobilizing transposase RayT
MGQSLSKMLVHFIFSTQERTPMITQEIKPEMEAFLIWLLNEHDSPSLQLYAHVDHVHILCNLSRKCSISEIMQGIKAKTSRWIKSKGKNFEKFQWQNGYGAFSVSESNKDSVIKYIVGQAEHHKKLSFQDEYRKFLIRHKISFDEKYVWD